MKEITAYQCKFCNYKTFENYPRHEASCEHNPECKRCQTCKHVIDEAWDNKYTGLPAVHGNRKCKVGRKQRYNQSYGAEKVCPEYDQAVEL